MAFCSSALRPWSVTLALTLILAGCAGGEGEPTPGQEVPRMSIEVTSSAFTEGARIPKKYTCDGQDISPALKWSGVPQKTKSIALICDDPDAPSGTWVHWVVYSIPPDVTELQEGVVKTNVLPDGAKQGTTDFKRIGYGGPCPPRGHGAHHYYFKVYALDIQVGLKAGATKKDLEKSMKGHILGQGQLIGTYERK